MRIKKLTDAQKGAVIHEWSSRPTNPPSLQELIAAAGYEGKDGRTKEGRAVKAFLASRDIRALAAHEYQPKPEVVLTEEQKEYCKNYASTMRPHEINKVLFPNATHKSQECKAIANYIEELKGEIELFEEESGEQLGEYKAIRTFTQSLNLINTYIYPPLSKDKLAPQMKKNIESLIGYVNAYRFLHIINTFEGEVKRALFESSFVRYTYDKADLAEEEVDQYIVLSAEVVISSNISHRVETLQVLLDETVSGGDGESTRISMSLVEAINTAQTEYNQCVNRQTKLLGDLKQKRSDRLSKQIKENASILNLVEMWKDEESRKKLIKLAETRKLAIKEEIGNLSAMDDVKARIMGLTEDEALNG
jgi:hypothetical protein